MNTHSRKLHPQKLHTRLQTGLWCGALVALPIGLFGIPQTVRANTCASQCPVKPIQFTPGQRIQVQVLNRTGSTIEIENASGDRPIQLLPGKQIKFYRGGSTNPNLSVVFWETTETPLKAALSQPKKDLLQIDLTFAATKPGDRSIYIRNDGRIDKL
jgi:hypothetical protein